MNPEWRSRYEIAQAAVDKASRLALSYFQCDLRIDWKQDESPVTIADRETETVLRTTLLEAFPNDGFLGEEHGEIAGLSGYRWIIDPIDGTRNFVRGIHIWGTLAALEYQGECIAGVVALPALGQVYKALKGDGAYRDGQRIHVSNVSTLDESLLLYTGLKFLADTGPRQAFDRLAREVQITRGFGDVYGYLLVAQGSAELMVEHGVHAWDVAAPRVIVEEAGGRFSNWDGAATIHKPDVIASNGKVHDAALHVLAIG